ncbi:DUF2892 domain-containing protein [Salinigranum sp.]|uniref:YgaP family membrane protein n=1 Tax=Salinigranum sp. TaxID=1966351 RepID=UPI0035664C47
MNPNDTDRPTGGGNVGTLDRTVRLFVGPALLVVALASLLGIVTLPAVTVAGALASGVLLAATGAVRTCPLYRLAGLDSHFVSGRAG